MALPPRRPCSFGCCPSGPEGPSGSEGSILPGLPSLDPVGSGTGRARAGRMLNARVSTSPGSLGGMAYYSCSQPFS